MKKKILISILFLTLFSAILPVAYIAHAQDAPPKLDYSGLVKCDGVINPDEADRKTKCDFAALMDTVNQLITWCFLISIPVATVLFAWAGLLFMRGTPGTIKKGKDIFTSVAIGFIIVLVAWISVRTFVDWFVKDSSGATTFLGK